MRYDFIKTMDDISVKVFQRLLRESSAGGYIYIFDFDDTLVKTKSQVKVMSASTGGHKTSLTPAEYAVYSKQFDDAFDFSDFEHVIEPRLTNLFYNFVNRIRNEGPQKVFILTARGNPDPVKQFLETIKAEYLLPASEVEVMAVGSSDPIAKSEKIKEKVRTTGATRVKFYDDSAANIFAADELNNDPEMIERGVRVETKLVKEV